MTLMPAALLLVSSMASVPPPLCVELRQSTPHVEPLVLRRAIAAELRREAVETADPCIERLTITVDALRNARVIFVGQGRGLERTVELPEDAGEAVVTLALLGASLARDEAGELLASHREAAPAVAPSTAPAAARPFELWGEVFAGTDWANGLALPLVGLGVWYQPSRLGVGGDLPVSFGGPLQTLRLSPSLSAQLRVLADPVVLLVATGPGVQVSTQAGSGAAVAALWKARAGLGLSLTQHVQLHLQTEAWLSSGSPTLHLTGALALKLELGR